MTKQEPNAPISIDEGTLLPIKTILHAGRHLPTGEIILNFLGRDGQQYRMRFPVDQSGRLITAILAATGLSSEELQKHLPPDEASEYPPITQATEVAGFAVGVDANTGDPSIQFRSSGNVEWTFVLPAKDTVKLRDELGRALRIGRGVRQQNEARHDRKT